VAKALGESARGEALLGKMDATLDLLQRTKPKLTIRVAGWDGGGSVPGKGSLFDAIVTAAGGTNIASAEDGDRSNSFDIEQLLMARPDVLAYGAADAATPSLRTDSDQHPLLLRLYAHRRISYPEALNACGVPESADAAAAFRKAMLEAMKFPPP
jgi:iron complex transport system substrate-binding protein